MTTNLHLGFNGNCEAAFAFYEMVFGVSRTVTMRYSDAPGQVPCPKGSENLVMHAAMPLGTITLMGADAPPGRGQAMGGFQIALTGKDETEVTRLFSELSQGGSVMMPLAPTFWSPLFGMCTDKFGVGWMLGLEGAQG